MAYQHLQVVRFSFFISKKSHKTECSTKNEPQKVHQTMRFLTKSSKTNYQSILATVTQINLLVETKFGLIFKKYNLFAKNGFD